MAPHMDYHLFIGNDHDWGPDAWYAILDVKKYVQMKRHM